jgi:fluoride ion exporter CrcB/FEX
MTASPARYHQQQQQQQGGEPPTTTTLGTTALPPDVPLNQQIRHFSRQAIFHFFYPQSNNNINNNNTTTTTTTIPTNHHEQQPPQQTSAQEESSSTQQQQQQQQEQQRARHFVEHFWKTYDDIIILSLFTQLGIVFRIAAAHWFHYFDGTFSDASPLFVNLPLNCLSTFLMGLLASGQEIMSILETRFTPISPPPPPPPPGGGGPVMLQEDDDEDDTTEEESLQYPNDARQATVRRRRQQRRKLTARQDQDEMRQVQLMALERRIRASSCLLLFPAQQEEIDIMEHYANLGQQERLLVTNHQHDDQQEQQSEENDFEQHNPNNNNTTDYATLHGDKDLDQILYNVSTQLATNVQGEFRQVQHTLQALPSLQTGWDQGTTPQAMSDDLLLGLRHGFCGALSSFSSWNSSMVSLIRAGNVQAALVGYLLGLQLPIVSYRFGQYVTAYIFVWKCRRQVRRNERRGYGIQVLQSDEYDDEEAVAQDETPESELPSVRAVATALFVLSTVAQLTSLSFYNDPDNQLLALSLFFSPFGVLMRWRLSRYNSLKPGFPLGTFTCNLLACALSGSLGSLLAGNPGPRERIVLVAFISGFGGTLSSVATFIVEVLDGVDPLLLKWNGLYYAGSSVFWAMVIGLVSVSSVDWADQVVSRHHHSS